MKTFSKKFSLIFGLVLVALFAMGARIGDDTVRIGTKTGADIEIEMGEGRLKWDSATSKMQFSNDSGASVKEIGSGGGGAAGINLLENSDFESGSPPSNWTASAGVFISETASPGFDIQSGSWDSSATSETLDSDFESVPLGLENRSCNATIQYKYATGSSGDYKLQVVGNVAGLIAEKDLSVTTDWVKDALFFSCPSSDSIKIRITSTLDGGVILIDNATLGRSDFVDLSQAELVASAFYQVTTNCEWTRASAAFGNFSVDADCPAISVEHSTVAVNTTDDDLPTLVFDTLPAGKYFVRATFESTTNVVGQQVGFHLEEDVSGTNFGKECGYTVGTGGSNDTQYNLSCKGFFEQSASGPATFTLEAFQGGGNTVRIVNNSNGRELGFEVWKVPSGAAEAITLETVGEHWDVSLGGANPSLGTSNVTTYSTINDAGLDLVINPGSQPARAACQTEIASGLTCPTLNEEIGLVIDISTTGRYRVCGAIAHNLSVDATGQAEVIFQWVETAEGSDTIISEGNSRVSSGNVSAATANNLVFPQTICGDFTFNSVGAKALKLRREQVAIASIISHQILADRAAPSGQRDIHITVDKLDQQFPTPIFTDLTNSLNEKVGMLSGDSTVKMGFVRYTCSGSSTITDQNSNWIASISNISGGACTLTFTTPVTSIIGCVHAESSSTPNLHLGSVNFTGVSFGVDCSDTTPASCGVSFPASTMCAYRE